MAPTRCIIRTKMGSPLSKQALSCLALDAAQTQRTLAWRSAGVTLPSCKTLMHNHCSKLS